MKYFLLSCMSLLFLSAPVKRSHSGSLGASPVDDVKITVYATGNIQGKFDPDDMGKGGLSALHTLIGRKRELTNDSDGVLLLHTGNFTGTENQNDFNNKVANDEFNIIDYMKFDAILFPEKEKTFAFKKKITAACPPNSTAKNKKTDFFIKHIEKRNTGMDVLCVSSESEKKDIPGTLKDRKKSRLFFILSNSNGRDIFPYSNLREDLPEDSIAGRSFIFQSHEKNNFFIKTESGSYICNSSGPAVCELEIILRSGHIISVNQRFITVNDTNLPLPNYPADKNITEFLTK